MECCLLRMSPLHTSLSTGKNSALTSGFLSQSTLLHSDKYYLIKLYCNPDYIFIPHHIKIENTQHCSCILEWLNNFSINISNRGVIL